MVRIGWVNECVYVTFRRLQIMIRIFNRVISEEQQSELLYGPRTPVRAWSEIVNGWILLLWCNVVEQ